MSQELDKLYSPSCWSKRSLTPDEIIQKHIQFIEKASINVKKDIPCQVNISYGSSIREKINIFGVDLKDAPIFIFVHGGYWQTPEIDHQSYEFVAKQFYEKQIRTIFIGYELCPQISLQQMVKNIQNAIKKCIQYGTESGTRGIYLSGHSAGAHLIASLYSDNNDYTKPEQTLIKGIFLISGVFDLIPIQKTYVNLALELDEDTALVLSPLKNDLHFNKEFVFVVVGEDESPEFLKQSSDFHEKLVNLGVSSELMIVEDVDHFNIMESFDETHFQLKNFIINTIINQNK